MSFTNIMGQGRVNQLGGLFINGRPLPPETRRQIIHLAAKGVKPCKISRDLRVSHGAVSKILNRYNETGSIMPGQIGGNPRSRLSIQAVERHIRTLREENPTLSPSDIRSALIERGVCEKHNVPTVSSINRHLRSRGFRKSHERWSRTKISTPTVVFSPSSGDGKVSDRLMTDSEFLVVADDDREDENGLSSSDKTNPRRTDVSGCSGYKSPDSSFCSFSNFRHNNNSPTIEDDEGNGMCKRKRRSGLNNYSIETILGTPSIDGTEKHKDVIATTAQRHLSGDVDFALPFTRLSPPSTSPPPIAMTQQHVARGSNNSSSYSSSASSSFSSSAQQHFSSVSTASSDEENNCGVKLPSMEERLVGDGGGRASGLNTITTINTISAEKSAALAEARRNRTSFSSAQLKVLEGVFERVIYPSVAVKEHLMAVTGLDEDKIITWFSNRRARKRKAALEWCRMFIAQLAAMCSINEAQQQQLRDALMSSLNGSGGGNIMPFGAVASLNHHATTSMVSPILASIMQQQHQQATSSPTSHHQQMWLQQHHNKLLSPIPTTTPASMIDYRLLNSTNNSLLLRARTPHAAVPQLSMTFHTPSDGGGTFSAGGNLAQALLLQLQQQQQPLQQPHDSNDDEAVLQFLKQFPEVAVQEKLQ